MKKEKILGKSGGGGGTEVNGNIWSDVHMCTLRITVSAGTVIQKRYRIFYDDTHSHGSYGIK
jgi:hypothetical protein